jgi:hypothetical protein
VNLVLSNIGGIGWNVSPDLGLREGIGLWVRQRTVVGPR